MGCATWFRAKLRSLRVRCRLEAREGYRPHVSVVVRLGSRSTLLPPRIIVKNDNHIRVSITSITFNYEHAASQAVLEYPIHLDPGERITIPTSGFSDPPEHAISDSYVTLKIPYQLVANGIAVRDTTCWWMGNRPNPQLN